MSGRGILFTNLLWHGSRGSEVETRARVVYSRHAGFKGDHVDPPEAASVEIVSITAEPAGVDVPAHFLTDEDLLAECLADWAEDDVRAAEWRAQECRDALLMGDDQ